MKQPLLHARTKAQLDLFLTAPSHGLILSGPVGIGKLHIASWIAQALNTDMHIVQKEEDLKTITIEQIRGLYSLTKTGRQQIVIVDEAQDMVLAAQNAFLKLLEEPPENTTFILTTANYEDLLPTIRSRTQAISVIEPTEAQFQEYFEDSSVDFLKRIRALGFRPAMVSESTEVESALTIVEQAKQFYAGDTYARHLLLITNNYERDWSKRILSALQRIVGSLIALKSTDVMALKKLAKQAQLLDETTVNIAAKPGSTKAHLTKLAEML